jgi:hypothetical protein
LTNFEGTPSGLRISLDHLRADLLLLPAGVRALARRQQFGETAAGGFSSLGKLGEEEGDGPKGLCPAINPWLGEPQSGQPQGGQHGQGTPGRQAGVSANCRQAERATLSVKTCAQASEGRETGQGG